MNDLQNTPWSRRRLSLLASGAIASLLLGLGLDADGEAKRKKRRRKNRKRNGGGDRCLGEGQTCTTDSFPGNGGCCEGLACDCGMPLCAVGFPGTCLPVVDPD